MQVEIIPFDRAYKADFRDLNIAWLEKYFFVEKKDKELLEDCETAILQKGGYIFFAKYYEKIVGCFSLIPHNDKTYELGKMAVNQEYQGHKIGQVLMNYAIKFANQNKWNTLLLYSSTKLPAALHIYEKFGFKYIELEKNLPYKRSDIKMELILKR